MLQFHQLKRTIDNRENGSVNVTSSSNFLKNSIKAMIKQIPMSLSVQRPVCKLWRRQYHWFCLWRILPWQGNSIPIVLHHFHNTPSSKNWWRFTLPEMFHICNHCLHLTDPESMCRPCASSLLATNHPLPAGDIYLRSKR